MDIRVINESFATYAIIDNVLDNPNELKQNIINLEPYKKAANETNTATKDFKLLKSGYGLFLNELKDNMDYDNILKVMRPVMKKILTELSEKHSFFKMSQFVDFGLLLNYYGNNDYYLPHVDRALLTIVHYIDAYEYEGGDLMFPELGHGIKAKDNRMVIFGGSLQHEVKPVIAKENNYRVTLTQFGSCY